MKLQIRSTYQEPLVCQLYNMQDRVYLVPFHEFSIDPVKPEEFSSDEDFQYRVITLTNKVVLIPPGFHADYGFDFVLAEVDGRCFIFDSIIADTNRDKLIRAHQLALTAIQGCTMLSDVEKDALQKGYRKIIRHEEFKPNTSSTLALAVTGGFEILFNPVVYSYVDENLAAVMIHEMMHISGFTHPPAGSNNYWDAPPPRAEYCISDAYQARAGRKLTTGMCSVDEKGRASYASIE